MSFTKIAVILTIALFAAGLVAMVRHGRTQPAQTTTFEPHRMNDFKKPETSELKKKLSAEQFAVTQQCSTEPPFGNAYWNNHKPGIYVDVAILVTPRLPRLLPPGARTPVRIHHNERPIERTPLWTLRTTRNINKRSQQEKMKQALLTSFAAFALLTATSVWAADTQQVIDE